MVMCNDSWNRMLPPVAMVGVVERKVAASRVTHPGHHLKSQLTTREYLRAPGLPANNKTNVRGSPLPVICRGMSGASGGAAVRSGCSQMFH